MIKNIFPNFNFAKIPFVSFGAGKIKELVKISQKFGRNCILLTGKSSLKKSKILDKILLDFESAKIKIYHEIIENEPSPVLIDNIVNKYRDLNIELIIGIGGGSVLDSGKAVSAMLKEKESVENFLEDVGTKTPSGNKIPYIAVPTTSGTGSEATKNAVLSKVGKNGYKKSLRHDNYIPDYAIIDPELIISCPSNITASCGLDAFSQLLESYVSTNANPLTDTLAITGISLIIENLKGAVFQGFNDINIRAKMAYASFLSGITLANAGLGIVHGFASSIGGMYEIPHGVICGTLLASANRITIELLKKEPMQDDKLNYLKKFAYVGWLFENFNKKYDKLNSNEFLSLLEIIRINSLFTNKGEILKYIDKLLENLEEWIKIFKMKRLSELNIKEQDFDIIASNTSSKNNPVKLSKDEIIKILKERY